MMHWLASTCCSTAKTSTDRTGAFGHSEVGAVVAIKRRQHVVPEPQPNLFRQLTAQVRELSAYDCYVGTPNTLPVANTVLPKIFAQSECFEPWPRLSIRTEIVAWG